MALSNTEVIERLRQLSGYGFEKFVAELWQRRGWDTTVTAGSNDKGIDIIATQNTPYHEKELIQAKRYHESNRVGGPEVQQYASLRHQEDNVDKVVVVTTSSFTDSAISIAKKANLKLVDAAGLAQLVDTINASDLVEDYTSKVGVSSENKVLKTTVQQPEEQQEGDTVVLSDTSDSLSMEIVGMGPIETTIQGGILQDTTYIDGIVFGLKIFNHNNIDHLIEDITDFNLVDEGGNTYYPANLGAGQFDDVWMKHGGKGKSLDLKVIEPGSRIKYAVAFSVPDRVKPAELRLERYNVKIQFNHESRKRIPELPPALKGIA